MDISEFFNDVETIKPYDGYFYSVKDAIIIAVLGSFCGLKNMQKIHQWASNEQTKKFLIEHFGIEKVPCYSMFTLILGLIDPKSFSEKFTEWTLSLIDNAKSKTETKTYSFDGKTVRSTSRMKNYDNPLHIISCQFAEFGITIGQKAVDGKSNEIPAVQNLLEILNIKGCMIVADALNCQTKTAEIIIKNGGDYLLSVKGNQSSLETEIADYIADDELRGNMQQIAKKEKNRERIETRTAFCSNDIAWIFGKEKWPKLACFGAIHTQFETSKGKSSEWHYYISNKQLSAQELLDTARKEWSVEIMHWLLDVHFSEDSCRAAEQRTQENLNIIRKIALNSLKNFKNETDYKKPISNLMFECLLNSNTILEIL